MSAQARQALKDALKPGKPSKYRSVRTVVDGHSFPSKREAARYSLLRLRERAGEITGLTLQPRYDLEVGDTVIGQMVADFAYFERGKLVVEDSKTPATLTAISRWKIKHFEAQYKRKVHLV